MMPTKKRLRAWTLAALIFWPAAAALPAADGPRLPQKYDPLIRTISVQYGVDPALVHSIIRAESGYDPSAVSSKGALGLMQLMPETARARGVRNALSAADNIEGGVKVLRDLKSAYGNRTDLILAAYNAGQGAVKKYDGVPPYEETQTYITRVKAFYQKERATTKTRLFEYRDMSGRLVVTNDIRLAIGR